VRWLSISARAERQDDWFPPAVLCEPPQPSSTASVSLSNSPPFHDPLLAVRGGSGVRDAAGTGLWWRQRSSRDRDGTGTERQWRGTLWESVGMGAYWGRRC